MKKINGLIVLFIIALMIYIIFISVITRKPEDKDIMKTKDCIYIKLDDGWHKASTGTVNVIVKK